MRPAGRGGGRSDERWIAGCHERTDGRGGKRDKHNKKRKKEVGEAHSADAALLDMADETVSVRSVNLSPALLCLPASHLLPHLLHDFMAFSGLGHTGLFSASVSASIMVNGFAS